MRPSSLRLPPAWLACLAALLLCLSSVPALRAQPAGAGHIQVVCEPGALVFLDGAFKGVANADQGGLVLLGVATGEHQVRVVREGPPPRLGSVTVGPGQIAEFRATELDGKQDPPRRDDKPSTKDGFAISGLNIEMIAIPAGAFDMGSATDGDEDERPVTHVTITKPFWLGKTEVTQGQWFRLMGTYPSKTRGEHLPVEGVSWDDAMKFCRKLTEEARAAGWLPEGYAFTLPTEAQWEYACRAGTTGDFAGAPDAMAWHSENSDNDTHQVGQKKANDWGLHDLHGNVWEWCLEWYGSLPGGAVIDPTGPASGSAHVVRGGSCRDRAAGCRSASRSGYDPMLDIMLVGFRLALTPAPAATARTDAQVKKPADQHRAEQPAAAHSRTIPDLNLELVVIAPGTFVMGSPLEYYNSAGDITPTEVTLTKEFWLGKTEVTQSQWTALGMENRSRHKGEELPVENVTWDDALEFCRKLNQREKAAGRLPEGYAYTLPTEAQWEYACRAGDKGSYPPDLAAVAWYSTNSDDRTHPVGQKRANAWGLHDLHGNVWEWCLDWYAKYPGGKLTDPAGPTSGREHVNRGGGCGNITNCLAYHYRSYYFRSDGENGFRLALAPAPAVGTRADSQAEKPAAQRRDEQPAAERNRTIADLNLELIAIAPGSFDMGSATGGYEDERPVTRVTISQPFWLGKTEVTQAQWTTVMDNNPSEFVFADAPVERVSWNDAMAFCRKLTERERAAGRLPQGHAYTLPTRRSGNTPAAQAQAAIRRTTSPKLPSTPKTVPPTPSRLACCAPMRGDCTICSATSGNGVSIGRPPIPGETRATRAVRPRARSGSFAAGATPCRASPVVPPRAARPRRQ